MTTTLYIPVSDIDSLNFDYDGTLTRDEYFDMCDRHYRETNSKIQNFIMNMYDEHNEDNRVNKNYETVDSTDGYRLKKCEAYIMDTDYNSATFDYFEGNIESNDMFIIIVDINPDTIDYDSETELRYWMLDSDKVLRDKTIDDTTKLKILPKTHFCIDINGKMCLMSGCKLFEMYKEKNHPFKFAILVEKIKEMNK